MERRAPRHGARSGRADGADARFVIFHCFDRAADGDPYYESLDLHQAAHPQTLLALDLNDARSTPTTARPFACACPPTRLQEREVGPAHRTRRLVQRHRQRKRRLLGRFGYDWYAGI